MATKPDMITIPAHATNQWSRQGLPFEFIVLHYVGAVSTARNNGLYYGREPNIGASAHFFVDEREVVASVPLTMAAGHCGVDYSGGRAPFWSRLTNRKSIGIEMCCKKDASGVWYIEPETVTKTAALVRWLMQEFGIDADHVIRHYDVCWKNCPAPWVEHPEQWSAFKRRITEEVYEMQMTKEEFDQAVTDKVKEILMGVNTTPSPWAEEEMGEKLEAVKHITDGTRPRGYTKREESAAMTYRLEKRTDEKIKGLQAQIDELKKEGE